MILKEHSIFYNYCIFDFFVLPTIISIIAFEYRVSIIAFEYRACGTNDKPLKPINNYRI